MATSSRNKSRYFAFEVYPENSPADWLEILKGSLLPFAVSPLHTPEDGKPHHHVIYKHAGPATLDCVKSTIPEGIAANGYIEPVHAPRNYQRYLIHLDNPEKQQFKASEIVVLNGFPLDLSRDFSKAELDEHSRRVFAIIREFSITEYADLIDYCLDNEPPEIYDYARRNTILYNTYITSVRNRSLPSEPSI